MKSLSKKKFTFFSIYLTFFVDNLCWAIVFPIFAPLFLDTNNTLFPADTSAEFRSMVLGFFLMIFSFGQFIGCPLIGEYADKHGRKKAFGISVFFTLIGISISAYSVQTYNLYLLFASRFVTGFFASSTSVCLSSISDLSKTEKTKIKNFGTLSMLAGFSFVAGAFLGGKLSDPAVSSYFSPNLPLWVASGLSFINLLFIIFGLEETAQINPNIRFHILEAFTHVKLVLKTKKIKKIYIVYFLFLFSWTIIFQFIPVLTVEKFNFTSSDIGDLALFMGVCWAIGSGYINKIITDKFNPTIILEFCLGLFTLFSAAIIVPEHIYGVVGIVGICVLLGGVAWPICTNLISNIAPREMQGKVMGLSQSIQSFAMTIGPLTGGLAFHVSLQLPFVVAASVSLASVILYFFILKQR